MNVFLWLNIVNTLPLKRNKAFYRKKTMEQSVWQDIEQLYQKFQKLGISEAVDYDKYYLYSLITHSTAIEGSTLTELDTQLLFDEGVTAKENRLPIT